MTMNNKRLGALLLTCLLLSGCAEIFGFSVFTEWLWECRGAEQENALCH